MSNQLVQPKKKLCPVCKKGIAIKTRLVPPGGGRAQLVYQCTNPDCRAVRKI